MSFAIGQLSTTAYDCYRIAMIAAQQAAELFESQSKPSAKEQRRKAKKTKREKAPRGFAEEAFRRMRRGRLP